MPFDRTTVIPANWSAHHQPVAEGAMTAAVTITIPDLAAPLAAYDDTTGRRSPRPRTVLYSGRARLQADFRPLERVQADQDNATRRYLVAIPADHEAPIPFAAVVHVDAAVNDPHLVGADLTVLDVEQGSERFETDLDCMLSAAAGG